jgi:hypothetical protein
MRSRLAGRTTWLFRAPHVRARPSSPTSSSWAPGPAGCSPGGFDGFEGYVHLNGWVNAYGYNVDEASVRARPAMAVDLAALGVPCEEGPVMLVADAGTDLLLEAEQVGDYTSFGAFARQFGMDTSWQPLLRQ